MEVNRFTGSLTRKVIIVFFVCVIALSAAWVVNRFALKQMLGTVEELTLPDERLLAVNKIFHQVINLDQGQNLNTSANKKKSYLFVKSSTRELQNSLDTFRQMCSDNIVQLELIDSVKLVLRQREKVLLNYLDVRENLISNKAFAKQIDTLSDIISRTDKDSIVVTTERQTLTTTMQAPEPIAPVLKPDKRRFLGKIFKKRKMELETPAVVEQTFIEEQVNTKVDTVVTARADSTIQEAGLLLREINARQIAQRKKFISKETELADIEKASIAHVMRILNTVEEEVIRQNAVNTAGAQKLVKKSADQTELIIIVFLGLTAFLVVVVLIDIARSHMYRVRLQKAKEEAEFHSLARQRFLANMSHEIRTPLQSILGFAEQATLAPVPARQHVEAIYRSSEHLLQIVNEVLDFSRITSGKFNFQKTDFDMLQLLDDVILSLRPQAQLKSIDLLLEADLPGEVYVSGDPFRLKQVLFNLVGNAIKFTEKGTVKLIVQGPVKKKVVAYTFIVEDTGIGIAPENLSRVFNQFEQADASINNRYVGTGLGLSIVKAIIEARQGSISVTSEVGKGSVFKAVMYFPAAAKCIKATANVVDTKPFSGKVWLVDDDHLIMKLCSNVLEKHGVKHRCFSSAEELLNEPWDNLVNLVFADMRLPGLNGAQLCTELRKRRGDTLPIIALTAQALPEEREAILSGGFNDILLKPFKAQQLIDALGTAKHVDTPVEETDFSLDDLKQITFGDTEQMLIILEQFIEDSTTDLQLLQLALMSEDVDTTVLVLHRLAGRTSQVCSRTTGTAFRQMEIQLDGSRDINSALEPIEDLQSRMKHLIEQVKQAMAEQALVYDSV